jgi:hypothetical protein
MQFMDLDNLKHFEPGSYMEISYGTNYYVSLQEKYTNVISGPLLMCNHQEYLYNIYALLCKAVVKRVEKRS